MSDSTRTIPSYMTYGLSLGLFCLLGHLARPHGHTGQQPRGPHILTYTFARKCETSTRAVAWHRASGTCRSSEQLAPSERRRLGWQAHAVDASLPGKEGGADELEDQLDEDHDALGLGLDLVHEGAVACGSTSSLSRLKSSMTVATSSLTSSPARHIAQRLEGHGKGCRIREFALESKTRRGALD